MRTIVAGLLLLSAAGFQASKTANLDPVGKWTFSTKSESGEPASGTMEITGKPGAYEGRIITDERTELKIVEVMTSPTGIMILADLPDGGSVVARVVRDASGVLTGAWGPVRPVIPMKLERAR
jgi:hypothetical protein